MENGEGFGFCPQTYRPAKTRTAHADATEPGRPDGLPTFATVSFVYDTPTAQVYTGVMDSLIGQSNNLDDQVPP